MLTAKLDRLGDRPWARITLGVFLVVAGVFLGAQWRSAEQVATEQASDVSAVCDQGGPAAAQLEGRGTCQTAREVIADPTAGPPGPAGRDGDSGSQGAAGSPGTPGRDGVGVPGTPGVVGPQGPAGIAGQDGRTVTGPQGPAGPTGQRGEVGPAGPAGTAGRPGAQGPQGEQGEQGAPGPTCPDGTSLAPVTFASGESGLGCVSP